ncbi:MAG: hypothetical protein SNH88_05830 [Rikenellaceae bacterium]
MFEQKELFWKNFRLGTELQVAGGFIYDALYAIDLLDSFDNADECFDILYKTSVGIERLAKVAIILLEHNDNVDQAEFEKSMITHNHTNLIKRVDVLQKLKLGDVHYQLLDLLSNFYKSIRYDRYNLTSVFHRDQDQDKLIEFVQYSLNVTIEIDSFISTKVDKRIKDFLGKTIIKISSELYEAVRNGASKVHLYTDEIRSHSKAFKIFMRKDINFETERILQSEIIISLLKNGTSLLQNNILEDYIKDLGTLDLDSSDINDQIGYLKRLDPNSYMIDEVEEFYADFNEEKKNRLELLSIIGNKGVYLSSDDDYEEYEDTNNCDIDEFDI